MSYADSPAVVRSGGYAAYSETTLAPQGGRPSRMADDSPAFVRDGGYAAYSEASLAPQGGRQSRMAENSPAFVRDGGYAAYSEATLAPQVGRPSRMAEDSPAFVRDGRYAAYSEATLAPKVGRPSHKAEMNMKEPPRVDDFSAMADHDHEDYPLEFPNHIAKWRYILREPLGEFFGTMILVVFGNGVNVHTTVSTSKAVAGSPKGDWLSVAIAWGMGAAIAVWISAEGSGAHLNPAWTLAQVLVRRFPLRKLPIYVLAQTLGAFTGALLVFSNYWRALYLFEGGIRLSVPGTAALFATYPAPYLSAASAWFDEFLSTALLFIGILTVTDKRHGHIPTGLVPFAVFIIVTTLASSFGFQTAFAMNPARDFGARLVTAIFYGREVWSFRSHYWLWSPIIAPICGGICATLLYDICFYTGADSKLNSPDFLGFSEQHQPKSRRGERAV